MWRDALSFLISLFQNLQIGLQFTKRNPVEIQVRCPDLRIFISPKSLSQKYLKAANTRQINYW